MGNIQFPLLTHKLSRVSQARLHLLGAGKPRGAAAIQTSVLTACGVWLDSCRDQAPGISEEKLLYWLINGPKTVAWISQNVTTPAFQAIKYNIMR